MIVGIRAHDFGSGTIEEMAEKIAAKEFPCIQLALAKAINNIDSSLGKLSPGLAKYIRDTLYKKNINIAVLGCYINPIDPDEGARRKQLDRFKEHIRYARDLGCSVVGTETGSAMSDFSYTPATHGEEAFQTLVASVRELVEEAEKFGVFVGIEGVTSHSIHTPEKMRRVLDLIPSNNLQVIFDPVNLVDLDNYQNQDEIIEESFRLFGDRIVILHAKDYIVENGQKKVVPVGKGLMNYELVLKHLKAQKPYVEILLEDVKGSDMEESRAYLMNLYQSL